MLDTNITIQNGTCRETLAEDRGCVEFRHVSFRYPNGGEKVLSDISFTAKPGQTVAFIGAAGSG